MFMLTCRHLHSKIAILEGKFYPDNVTIYENSTYPFEPENPRIALNKRSVVASNIDFLFCKARSIILKRSLTILDSCKMLKGRVLNLYIFGLHFLQKIVWQTYMCVSWTVRSGSFSHRKKSTCILYHFICIR